MQLTYSSESIWFIYFLHFCWMFNNWNMILVLVRQTLISQRMRNGIGLLLFYSLSKSWMGGKQIIQTTILMDLDLIYARFYGLQSLSMSSFSTLCFCYFSIWTCASWSLLDNLCCTAWQTFSKNFLISFSRLVQF